MRNSLNDILNENGLLTLTQINEELTTYLPICPLSHPCLSVTSCCPIIEFTLVYKYSMIHYIMAHEPGDIVDSFLQDNRAVSSTWEWPCQFYTVQQTIKCSCYCAVMYCPFFFEDDVSIFYLSVLVLAGNFRLKYHSGNSSFHHLLDHDLLLLVVSLRSFPLASIVQRNFLPLISSLR